MRSLDRGIDDDEAKRLIKRLSQLANKHIDIPYVPEAMEYLAIRLIISIIINAARDKWDFTKAKDALSDKAFEIPRRAKVRESEWNALVA